MKYLGVVLCVLCSVALSRAPSRSSAPGGIAVPRAILQALREENPVAYTWFDSSDQEVRAVPPDRIPADVRKAADRWMRKVVRPHWVAEDYAQRLRGESRTVSSLASRHIDLLCFEHSRGGGDFWVVDGPTGLSVLWRNPNIQTAGDAGKTAVLLAQCLLQLPEEEASALRPQLKQVDTSEGPVFVGNLDIPLEPLPRDEWIEAPNRDRFWHRQWYHHVKVWLASECFYVSIAKRTGRPLRRDEMQATPGSTRRFGDIPQPEGRRP